jgi:tripartite-type tricarboxylate transporter receptor subunit TctC
MREAGLKDVVFYSWQGIVAPARTPPEVIAKLNAEAVRALKQPDAAARITADGAEILAGTPAEFGSYIKSELARFGKVIKDSGVKPE